MGVHFEDGYMPTGDEYPECEDWAARESPWAVLGLQC